MLTDADVKRIADELEQRLRRTLGSDWFTKESVLEMLGFGRTTLDEIRSAGLFVEPALYNGVRPLWRRGDVQEWQRRVELGEVDISPDGVRHARQRQTEAILEGGVPTHTTPPASPPGRTTGRSGDRARTAAHGSGIRLGRAPAR